MTEERLKQIAEHFCDVFERYSVNPPIDRILPEYRVANDDITQAFPDYSILDREALMPHLRKAMRRRGLSFRRGQQ